ncbi:MAG: gamma-aminobutyraldehyde dehydrogenase [Methylacidiphilales bacterium]|nr:gamma-aminobutyraldehyde dehydrogenase [Candidatus Methylacidiphilales bacterium]
MLIGASLEVGAGQEEMIYNPRNGSVIVKIAEASNEQVDRAVEAASHAFQTWSHTTPAERSLLLLKLADAIERNLVDYASLESLNCGKPSERMRQDEMPAIIDCFRFFAGACRTMIASPAGEYLQGYTSMLRRDPIGVVGSIAPWNYPLQMVAWKIAPAVATGNTIVVKPSEQTPLTALLLAKEISSIFPPGVINIITGRGEQVGSQLVSHPKVDMVSLTGDVHTGKKILQLVSSTIKKTHLELGGKAPVIVLDDADISQFAESIKTFGYYNSGQDCTAACRIYAQKNIYKQVVQELATKVKTIQYNKSDDSKNDIGPLISAKQQERVSGFVERAKASNHMEVVTGGSKVQGTGYYFEPTVIAGALPNDEIVKREVFGPVVTVTEYETVEQAIQWANQSEYGLSSSVWGSDIGKALFVASRLRFGCSWVNTHFLLATEMPHGGMKQSGYGKDLSMYALEDYTVLRHIMIKL